MLNLNSLFPMRNNLYLLPHWVVEILHRHQLHYADVLNFHKLRPILSMYDLASIEILQSFDEELFGTKDIIGSSILYEWYSTANDNEELKSAIQQVELISKDATLRDSLRQRFNVESGDIFRDKLFEVIALDTKALAVILYPGVFSGQMYEHQYEITRTLLKQLYVYEHQTDVARTPLYRRYLELLSVRKP